MAKSQADRRILKLHAELCKTLANPTRLEILGLLRDGEKSVSELTALTAVRQATISQHLAILRQRGVVTNKKEGVNIYYKVTNPKMIQACDLIREVLFEQIADMGKLTRREGSR